VNHVLFDGGGARRLGKRFEPVGRFDVPHGGGWRNFDGRPSLKLLLTCNKEASILPSSFAGLLFGVVPHVCFGKRCLVLVQLDGKVTWMQFCPTSILMTASNSTFVPTKAGFITPSSHWGNFEMTIPFN